MNIPAGLGKHVETTFLAVVNGALSFVHIHQLAVRHHLADAWAYPFAIDALTLHALRLILRPHQHIAVRILAWVQFVVFALASLAANLLDADLHDPIGMGLSAAPSVAFLFSTLLGHLMAHLRQPAEPEKDKQEQDTEPNKQQPPPSGNGKGTKPGRKPRTVATSRAAIARSLAPEFRKSYTGPERDRGVAFRTHVNDELRTRGLKALDERACRRALSEG